MNLNLVYIPVYFISECAVSFTQPTKVPPAYMDVYVQEGRDAKVVWTCTYDNRNELDLNRAVAWYTFIPQLTTDISNREGLIVEKRDETRKNLPTIPSYLTGRISIEDPSALAISNVKTTDDNFYGCVVKRTSLLNSAVSSWIRLTVISKQYLYFHCVIQPYLARGCVFQVFFLCITRKQFYVRG